MEENTASWISKRVDKSHYHYFCTKCGSRSRYRKGIFCQHCGARMIEPPKKGENKIEGEHGWRTAGELK